MRCCRAGLQKAPELALLLVCRTQLCTCWLQPCCRPCAAAPEPGRSRQPGAHLLDQHVCRQQAAHGANGQLKHMHPGIHIECNVGRQPPHRVLQPLLLAHHLQT